MRKLAACFLVVIFLLSSLGINAFAEAESDLALPESTTLFMKESIASGETELDSELYLKLCICDALYTNISNFNMSVDMSAFGLSWEADGDTVLNCMSYVCDIYPELFWFERVSPRFWRYSSNGKLTKIVFDYEPSVTDREQVAEYYKLIDDLVSRVPKTLSRVEQLLFVYNYLAVNFEYDTSFTNYDAYSFLTEKKGVCDAYALTFKAIMTKLGIPCTRAIFEKTAADSDDLTNHAWNIVKLNGENYHIDATWGDPTPDIFGRASFDYFMLDTDELEDEDESGNHDRYNTSENLYLGSYNVRCDDDEYDEDYYFWDDLSKGLAYYNGDFYFLEYKNVKNGIATASIYRTNGLYYSKRELVTTVSSNCWRPNTVSAFSVFYSTLAIIGSQLYYNTVDAIMCYDLTTGESYEVADLSEYSSLYSLTYLGDSVFGFSTVEFKKYFNTSYAVYVTSGNTVQIGSMGDINLNGTFFGSDDMVSLRKYILTGDSSSLCLANGDVSGGDMTVNVKDLVKMKKMAAGI